MHEKYVNHEEQQNSELGSERIPNNNKPTAATFPFLYLSPESTFNPPDANNNNDSQKIFN